MTTFEPQPDSANDAARTSPTPGDAAVTNPLIHACLALGGPSADDTRARRTGPSVLAPPKSIPESYIPRRDVYSQYWTEVSAA